IALFLHFIFCFQAEDGIRYRNVTGVQTCALPIFPQIYSSLLFMALSATPNTTPKLSPSAIPRPRLSINNPKATPKVGPSAIPTAKRLLPSSSSSSVSLFVSSCSSECLFLFSVIETLHKKKQFALKSYQK